MLPHYALYSPFLSLATLRQSTGHYIYKVLCVHLNLTREQIGLLQQWESAFNCLTKVVGNLLVSI